MKIQVRTLIESKLSPTDLTPRDSSLQHILDEDHYLSLQYFEATQIITYLHDLLADIADERDHDVHYSPQSTIERRSNNGLIQHSASSAAGTDHDSSATDLCNLINELTHRLRAQLDSYTANQCFITHSTNRLSAAIDIIFEGVGEIDELLIPVRFDDRDK